MHPAPSIADIDEAVLDLRKENFGNVPLDCIMLTQSIKNLAYPPLGLFPTYCLDRDKTSLRASFNFGSMLVIRNHVGLFQQRTVAIDQAVNLANTLAAKSHIESLGGAILTPANFEPTAGMIRIQDNPVGVSAAVTAGNVIQKINPIYPEKAKRNRVSGTVVFKALIGTDGRIHSLKLVSPPDSDLALASFAAVTQWTYKPYLLNGVPTSVDTTIRVNFSFGPH